MSILLLSTLSILFGIGCAYPFRDISVSAGLARPLGRRKKYGGACVADLNGDGLPDLLFGHHGDRWMQAYINRGNSKFKQVPFYHWADIHGLTAVRLSPYHRTLHFALSRGGRNGESLAPVFMFRMLTNGSIIEVTSESGDLERTISKGRGRSTIFINMHRNWKSKSFPDMLSLNANDGSAKHQKAFDTQHTGRFVYRTLSSAISKFSSSHGMVTDIDNDGKLELVLFYQLSVWQLRNDFHWRDVSRLVLPGDDHQYTTVGSVAELDYDNDGFWDLYASQSASSELDWVKRRPVRDALLRNIGGKRYRDVSIPAKIPSGSWKTVSSRSRGVTTGDFNNDGFVDIFISMIDGPDDYHLLLNNGDGTFRTIRNPVRREKGIMGDSATAVDLDNDGRLDLVISEGDWFKKRKGGFYRIIKNVSDNKNRFLLVRVLNQPRRTVTGLHAVVYVTIWRRAGSRKRFLRMMRRVSNPGVTVSQSFIETLHFGVGRHEVVDVVKCVWSDGSSETKRNVRSNKKITFGIQ